MKLRIARKMAGRNWSRCSQRQRERADIVVQRSWLRAARKVYGGGGRGRPAGHVAAPTWTAGSYTAKDLLSEMARQLTAALGPEAVADAHARMCAEARGEIVPIDRAARAERRKRSELASAAQERKYIDAYLDRLDEDARDGS